MRFGIEAGESKD